MGSLIFGKKDIMGMYAGSEQAEKVYSGSEDIILDYPEQYLTFEIISGGTLYYEWYNSGSTDSKVISYSVDGGTNWSSFDAAEPSEINVSAGDRVMFKGLNEGYAVAANKFTHITGTSEYNVYGNIMSLVYGDSFTGQTELTSAFTFASFFRNNANVKSVRNLVLPATTLADSCYRMMFSGASSITSTPKLPATGLTQYCYGNMFTNCSSLLVTPELPATSLAASCYFAIFSGCTSVAEAPELPSRMSANSCYHNMFNGCTSLTKAPKNISIQSASNNCFNGMFKGCTSLKASPEIHVTSSVSATSAFAGMFSGCTSLSSVYCDCSITTAAVWNKWLAGVAAKGVIYRNVTAQGIPSGWILYNGYRNYANNYLKLTIEQDGYIYWNQSEKHMNGIDMEYSLDGTTWYKLLNGMIAPVQQGDTLYFRGKNDALATSDGHFAGFSGSTAMFSLSGNILSLIYGDDFLSQTGVTSSYTFAHLFAGTNVTDVTYLVLPVVEPTPYCYANMFENCTYLERIPKLPLNYISEGCCKEMFKGCIAMGSDIQNWTQVATAERCYEGMFSGCTSLPSISLFASTLTPYCYANMFEGCTNLNDIYCSASNVGEEGAAGSLDNWLSGVSEEGTFTKLDGVTYPSGASGIPDGWTVVDIN